MTMHAFIHHGVESSTGCFKLMLGRMIADAIKMVELMVFVLFVWRSSEMPRLRSPPPHAPRRTCTDFEASPARATDGTPGPSTNFRHGRHTWDAHRATAHLGHTRPPHAPRTSICRAHSRSPHLLLGRHPRGQEEVVGDLARDVQRPAVAYHHLELPARQTFHVMVRLAGELFSCCCGLKWSQMAVMVVMVVVVRVRCG